MKPTSIGQKSRSPASLVIDKEFVLKTDLTRLRDILFEEDSNGDRYREKVMDAIWAMGAVKWFEARGLPTDDNSVWKNRYTGSETTAGSYLYEHYWGGDFRKKANFDREGYFLWENWLPVGMWIDKWKHKEGLEKWGATGAVAKNVGENEEDEDDEEDVAQVGLGAWIDV